MTPVEAHAARRFHEIAELWTAQDWRRWEQTCATSYRFDPGVGPVRDLPETLAWSEAVFAAFPDYRQHVDHVIVTERRVAGIITATATFTGPLNMAGGTIAPTGRRFSLPYVKILELDTEGRVAVDVQMMNYAAMSSPSDSATPGEDLAGGGNSV